MGSPIDSGGHSLMARHPIGGRDLGHDPGELTVFRELAGHRSAKIRHKQLPSRAV